MKLIQKLIQNIIEQSILCYKLHATRYTLHDQNATSYKLQVTRNQAFGLIEVIVSTSIILIVAGAALGLGRLALKNSVISYERTQADNLAREAIETVRNYRDQNWNNGHTTQFCTGPNGLKTWIDDNTNKSIKSIWNQKYPSTDPLLFDGKTFKRTVEANMPDLQLLKDTIPGFADLPIQPDSEKFCKITVVVSWTSYGKTHTTNIDTVLTDWAPADVSGIGSSQ